MYELTYFKALTLSRTVMVTSLPLVLQDSSVARIQNFLSLVALFWSSSISCEHRLCFRLRVPGLLITAL